MGERLPDDTGTRSRPEAGDLERLQGRLATLISTLDTLRASTAWKLAERMMRLVMNPGRLGRGPTGLDTFHAQIADLRRAAGLPHAPGEPFRVGLVVTDDPPDTSAGDVFTAMELAAALERELGWQCTFLARHGRQRDWYDAWGLDAIIVLLHEYDLTRVRDAGPGLVRIAWLRNWFDAWVAQPWFNGYDLALCSSDRARDWVADHSAVHSRTLRIATNPDRFRPDAPVRNDLRSDYCFTGSWWHTHRAIADFDPGRLPYDFALYGANWEGHDRLTAHWRGVLPYADMPAVYAGTELLIDDANHATRPWGSVNSRVFDALASGTLVVTNGVLGASEVFGEQLPTWEDVTDLEAQVRHFMERPDERRAMAQSLRQAVVDHHTYDHRAHELGGLLTAWSQRPRLAIKLPVPDLHQAREWGDFHFGSALARALDRLGYRVRLDFLPDWHHPRTAHDDVVIVLRGLSTYQPRSGPLNLMWLISHPEQVEDAEFGRFDHVFVASRLHAEKLAGRLAVPVSPLLQCTDPSRFAPDDDARPGKDVVFVGNSRGVARPAVIKAIEAGLEPKVYGAGWKGLIDDRYIHGDHVDNDRLGRLYAEAGVVLNDHWPDMRQSGFISNRLFDLAACGAVFLTDDVPGAAAIFGDCYMDHGDTPDEFRAATEHALASRPELASGRRRLAQEVAMHHSFDARARDIHRVVLSLHRAGHTDARARHA